MKKETTIVEEESVEKLFEEDIKEKKIIGRFSRRTGGGELRVGSNYGDKAPKNTAVNIDQLAIEIAKSTTVLGSLLREKFENDMELVKVGVNTTLSGLDDLVASVVKTHLTVVEQEIYRNIENIVRDIVESSVSAAVNKAFSQLQLNIVATPTNKNEVPVNKNGVIKSIPTKHCLPKARRIVPKGNTSTSRSTGSYTLKDKESLSAPVLEILNSKEAGSIVFSKKYLRSLRPRAFSVIEKRVFKMLQTLDIVNAKDIESLTASFVTSCNPGGFLRSCVYGPGRVWSGWHDFHTDLIDFRDKKGRWSNIIIVD